MGKPAVSRDAFRGLFAFYAAKAHHDHKPKGEHCLLKLFGSAEDIPDSLLLQWSDRVELLGSENRWPLNRAARPSNQRWQGATMPVTFSTRS
ncbi:hypothetical protein ABIF65_005546 [Bradyrhizobium japonicum]|uniref:hypothetical protein n=1 Tax=Bradyrhizobium TaxID=374 RepID=UPI002012A78C|nr:MULTISPECIES: hypothetical protein [Bradyrhizobium]WLC00395.1 hypothetical protein QIH92_13930 [Bradyrhizobium japonicum USDA 123]MCP1743875.1 hypothetical protein [Bradyrhizobium japonicum]MCP1782170.1 hypothetical protein [Bradyrhizobium japonicum]MCP1861590.1 hypothetical protein [Bradyrhizobium japonicum]MCP1892349.1 hypothetical protein [Bradyrhizobium japonicum]